MLHPSSADLSKPIDYFPALWTETCSSGTPNIIATGGGIKLTPPTSGLSQFFVQTQFFHGFNLSPEIIVLVASRLLITDVANCSFCFGLWQTHANVFDGSVDNGIFFRTDAQHRLIGHTEKSDPPPGASETDPFDAAIPESHFLDLGIAIRVSTELRVADFLWRRVDGTWDSKSLNSNIPTLNLDINSIRPSFAYLRGTGGHLVARSLYVYDVGMNREGRKID